MNRVHTLCMTESDCLAYRVTRFDNNDNPDFSRLGQSRNDPHSSRFDQYDSRPGASSNRDPHRQGDSSDNSFPAVRERVQMGIATSHSHTEALQDLVLSLSEGTSRRDAESDKSVLKDLVKEMLTFRCSLCQYLQHNMGICMYTCVTVVSGNWHYIVQQHISFRVC